MKSGEEVLQDMVARLAADAGLRESVGASYAIHLNDTKQSWTLRVRPKTELIEGTHPADCSVALQESELVKIAEGMANPQALYATGKLAVEGDIDSALKLVHLW